MQDKQTFTEHVVTDTDLQRNCMGGGQLAYIKQQLCVFPPFVSQRTELNELMLLSSSDWSG